MTPARGRRSIPPAAPLYGREEGGGGGPGKMAAVVRQDLAQLMNSSGSHKDLAGK